MVGERAANVLMTTPSDAGVGGVQVAFRDLVYWLEESGWHVHLLYQAPLPGIRLVEKINHWGRRAFYCPMPAIVRESALLSVLVFLAYLPIVFFHLARVIRREKIDVVNCYVLDVYFIHLVIAARLLRVPIVVSVHGADIDGYTESSPARRLLYRLIMRGANRIVACSHALAKQTVEVFPNARGKVTYVHNGLELSHYAAVPDSGPLPRPFLLCVCRQVHKKGVDTLLQAFAQVLRTVPVVSLVLVGDGPLLEEHKGLARKLRIDHQVVFVGNVAHDDVPAFFAECTLFVLPSRNEPFGIVVLEAAYYKKGIVCTRVGGVPEIITNGVSGLVVEPDDPAAMAAQILTLLRNPELAGQLGLRAHQTLMARFLWSQRVLDYIAIYEGHPGPSLVDLQPGPFQ